MNSILRVIYTYYAFLCKNGRSCLSGGWKENYGFNGRYLDYHVYYDVCGFLDKYGI